MGFKGRGGRGVADIGSQDVNREREGKRERPREVCTDWWMDRAVGRKVPERRGGRERGTEPDL